MPGFASSAIRGCGGAQTARSTTQEAAAMAGHLAVFPSIGFEQERESMKGFMGGADPKRWHLLVGAFHLAWSAISLTGVV